MPTINFNNVNQRIALIILKASYDAHLEAPLGKNYYRVIAQKGEIKTEPSNVIVI